jgi:hypothetical protein
MTIQCTIYQTFLQDYFLVNFVWKNNSCESINHILKLNQDWKPEKLPELINKIHKEIVLQESLVNGALYGHGDVHNCSSVGW